jgi:hypothetical protein
LNKDCIGNPSFQKKKSSGCVKATAPLFSRETIAPPPWVIGDRFNESGFRENLSTDDVTFSQEYLDVLQGKGTKSGGK